MKKLEDKEFESLLKESMLEEAPKGMVARIMNHVMVHPVRRLTVQPVKAKPVAALLPLLTILLLGLALLLKPHSWVNFSMGQYLQLNISPIWIAPVAIFALAIWASILLRKYWEPYMKN